LRDRAVAINVLPTMIVNWPQLLKK